MTLHFHTNQKNNFVHRTLYALMACLPPSMFRKYILFETYFLKLTQQYYFKTSTQELNHNFALFFANKKKSFKSSTYLQRLYV